MMKPEEAWIHFYTAIINNSSLVYTDRVKEAAIEAAKVADVMLEEYKKRFPEVKALSK